MSGHVRENNTSGYTGVRRRVRANGQEYFQARIYLRGKETCLGSFDTIEEAVQARKKAESVMFGEIIEQYEDRHK